MDFLSLLKKKQLLMRQILNQRGPFLSTSVVFIPTERSTPALCGEDWTPLY